MAEWAKEKRKKGEYWRIFLNIEGERKRISVGYVKTKAEKKAAEKKLSIIDDLEALKNSGKVITEQLRESVNQFDEKFANKLIAIGLVRVNAGSKTLKKLFEAWIFKCVKTCKARTCRNYRQAVSKFEEYLGENFEIEKVTKGDVDEFAASCEQDKLEKSTIGNYLKRIHQAFEYAVDHEWIAKNPVKYSFKKYASVKAGWKKQKQEELINEKTLAKLLDSSMPFEWKLLISFERWTACRVAEMLILPWSAINFDFTNEGTEDFDPTIKMRGKDDGSGATRDDMPERVMPLWPELRVLLLDHRQNNPHEKYVFNEILSLRDKPEFEITRADGSVVKRGRYETNADQEMTRIIKRAGLEVWPAPHHGIREYRLNEIRRQGYTEADITAWCGNNEQTRKKHYDNVGKADRQRVTAIGQHGNASGQIVAKNNPHDNPQQPVSISNLQELLEKIADGSVQVYTGEERIHLTGVQQRPKPPLNE